MADTEDNAIRNLFFSWNQMNNYVTNAAAIVAAAEAEAEGSEGKAAREKAIWLASERMRTQFNSHSSVGYQQHADSSYQLVICLVHTRLCCLVEPIAEIASGAVLLVIASVLDQPQNHDHNNNNNNGT